MLSICNGCMLVVVFVCWVIFSYCILCVCLVEGSVDQLYRVDLCLEDICVCEIVVERDRCGS